VDDAVTTTYQYRQSGKHADQEEEAGLAARLDMLDSLEMSGLCFDTPQQAAEKYHTLLLKKSYGSAAQTTTNP
jgi:hypothetical protein